MSSKPARILFLRPDTYGDLILFEPVLRLVREAFPEAVLAVLIRAPYSDIAPLIGDEGITWLATTCDPYREGPRNNRVAFDALRAAVVDFAPDCLVAACFERTWLEGVVATFLPEARQISLGTQEFNSLTRGTLEVDRAIDWPALYPERVQVEIQMLEWEKNIRLAHALRSWLPRSPSEVSRDDKFQPLARVVEDLGLDPNAPTAWARLRPKVSVSADARSRAAEIFSTLGVNASEIAICCPAGTANVKIKSWPEEYFGQTLAWMEQEKGIRSLLIGHESERETLELVQRSAREKGGAPEIWVGRSSEMPIVAGLIADARAYFGNDTGILHLAAALDRPTVSIFGGGHWPRFKPVSRRSAVIVQPLPCFGCDWNCLFGYAPCVKEIPPRAARTALEWLLASDEDGEKEFAVEDAIPESGQKVIAGAVAAHRDFVVGGANSSGDFSQLLLKLERQGAEIVHLQGEVDRWLKEVKQLWPKLNEATNARAQMAAELKEMRAHFTQSEADRNARLKVIEKQAAENARLEGEVDRWLKEAGALWPKLNAAENARNLVAAEKEELHAHFLASEADRAARLKVIESQGAEKARLEAEVDRWLREAQRWLKEAGERWSKLNAAENARALLAAELDDARRALATNERLREELVVEKSALQQWQARVEQHWAPRILKKFHLWPG